MGVLEDLEKSLDVLECKVPQYFKVKYNFGNFLNRFYHVVSLLCDGGIKSNQYPLVAQFNSVHFDPHVDVCVVVQNLPHILRTPRASEHCKGLGDIT